LNILFVGDIFGSAGRRIVREHIGHVREAHHVELTIVNAENAAGGFGLTPQIAEDIFDMGADVLTMGNHVWDKKELIDYLNSAAPESVAGSHAGSATANSSSVSASVDRPRRVLRPANFPPGTPGYGVFEGTTASGVDYAVIQLQGRVFMTPIDDPFRTADALLAGIKAKVIVVDFHAEATSEKVAMGWYLDGRVTAVLGTHTHIPTADERILHNGTAFQTDVGMSGPYDSIIGVEKELVLHKFLTAMPGKFEAAKGNPKMCAALVTCDPTTGRASAIQRIMLGE
jgi:2',3'-cyclic-nucleotide 2'-phosphodiesterase